MFKLKTYILKHYLTPLARQIIKARLAISITYMMLAPMGLIGQKIINKFMIRRIDYSFKCYRRITSFDTSNVYIYKRTDLYMYFKINDKGL